MSSNSVSSDAAVSVRRTDVRRSELIRAASSVIFARSYRNSSVADITAEACVAHGTFYNYFDSRREILDAVVDFEFEGLVEAVVGDERLDAAATAAAFAAQFGRMHSRLHRVVERKPELIRFVLFDAASIDREVIDRLLGLFGRIGDLGAQFVRNGIDRGFVDSTIDIPVAADMFTSILSASALVVLQELENGASLDPSDSARVVESYVDFFVHALGR